MTASQRRRRAAQLGLATLAALILVLIVGLSASLAQESCPEGFVFVEDEGGCVEAGPPPEGGDGGQQQQCPEGQVFSESEGGCVDAGPPPEGGDGGQQQCPEGQVFSESEGGCVDVPSAANCIEGQVFVPSLGDCVDAASLCGTGLMLNQATGLCEAVPAAGAVDTATPTPTATATPSATPTATSTPTNTPTPTPSPTIFVLNNSAYDTYHCGSQAEYAANLPLMLTAEAAEYNTCTTSGTPTGTCDGLTTSYSNKRQCARDGCTADSIAALQCCYLEAEKEACGTEDFQCRHDKGMQAEHCECNLNDSSFWRGTCNGLMTFFGDWIGQLGTWVLVGIVAAWGWVKGDAWGWIKQAGTDAWNWTKQAATDGWNATKKAVSDGWNETKKTVSDGWDNVKKGATDMWNGIKSFFS